MANREIALLLTMIEQAYDHKSWHGTNLKGSIKGLPENIAAWRPAPSRHNIWEIVVHAAYWKYIVCRRLLSEGKGSFPLKGSNWFPRPSGTAADSQVWKAEVKLLEEMHRRLLMTIAALKPRDIDFTPSGSKVSNQMLLTGIAAHDLYHAGQIQLLKRLYPKS
jgi:hypothetical protein